MFCPSCLRIGNGGMLHKRQTLMYLSKHQSVINLPQLLLPKSEVSAGDGGA